MKKATLLLLILSTFLAAAQGYDITINFEENEFTESKTSEINGYGEFYWIYLKKFLDKPVYTYEVNDGLLIQRFISDSLDPKSTFSFVRRRTYKPEKIKKKDVKRNVISIDEITKTDFKTTAQILKEADNIFFLIPYYKDEEHYVKFKVSQI